MQMFELPMSRRRINLALPAVLAMALLAGAPSADAAKVTKPKVVKAVTSASGAGSIASAAATCPGGSTNRGPWRALSGGFEMDPSSSGVVFESVREGARSWRVSAQVLSGGVGLTAYVNCQRGVSKPRTISAALATPGAPQVGPTAVAQCPSGLAVGGGFSTPPPFTALGAANTVVGSFPNGRRQWRAQVISSQPSSVKSFVYCAERSGKPKVAGAAAEPTSVVTIAGTTALSTSGHCPPGRFAPGGGGFRQHGMTASDYLVPTRSSQRPSTPPSTKPPGPGYKGNVWQASGLKVGSAAAVRIEATAICG